MDIKGVYIMEFLTIKELMGILKVSRQTIERKIKNGTIKTVKVGGQHRISKEWLEEYIKSGGDR